MELEKKRVRMNRMEAGEHLQCIVEEDVNVPENKGDIETLICNKAKVLVEGVAVQNGKAKVSGKWEYYLLYECGEEQATGLELLSGRIEFQELINIEERNFREPLNCEASVEDLKVRMINSRKISIKAVINLSVTGECTYEEEIAWGIPEGEIKTKTGNMPYISQVFGGTDLFRIKEELELPRNKPEINHILWQDITLREREIRLLTDGFSVKGELSCFLLYDSYEESGVQWYETVIPFSGNIDYTGVREEMISDIVLKLAMCKLEPKTNSDGEDRLLHIEAELTMDIRIFKEESVEYLQDFYSLKTNLTPVYTNTQVEQLIVKNNAKTRVIDKLKVLQMENRILQICGIEGSVHLDEIQTQEDRLIVEGALTVRILYVTPEGQNPITSLEGAIPFTQRIEVEHPLGEELVYTLRPNLDQLAATVLGNDEVEVRGIVNLDTFVLTRHRADFITGVTIEEQEAVKFPGLIGYIAETEEDLWTVAKKYRTTVEKIRQRNGINRDTVQKGEKLLILR